MSILKHKNSSKKFPTVFTQVKHTEFQNSILNGTSSAFFPLQKFSEVLFIISYKPILTKRSN